MVRLPWPAVLQTRAAHMAVVGRQPLTRREGPDAAEASVGMCVSLLALAPVHHVPGALPRPIPSSPLVLASAVRGPRPGERHPVRQPRASGEHRGDAGFNPGPSAAEGDLQAGGPVLQKATLQFLTTKKLPSHHFPPEICVAVGPAALPPAPHAAAAGPWEAKHISMLSRPEPFPWWRKRP
eukprot:9741944-Alexandrium_andersonii.AAC.1